MGVSVWKCFIFLREGILTGVRYVEPQGRGKLVEVGGGKQVQLDESDWHSKEVRGPQGKLITFLDRSVDKTSLIDFCL